jgi:chromate reductase
MSTSEVKLLGFAGSLRKDAFSKAVLMAVKQASTGKAHFDVYDLSSIPLYNQDVEDAGHPDEVTRFKTQIADSDGLVICTPEYNYGISGVLKNALDWASRPGYKSVLKDKPVLMVSSSPSFTGGVRAIEQLRQTLSATLSRIINVPEIVIGEVGHKITDGLLSDETSLRYIGGGLDALVKDIQMLKSAGVAGPRPVK